jgi:predicted unusual protein kinase regulating ubiquinone biosynthesis (AarF/ABC1/UbiB family)
MQIFRYRGRFVKGVVLFLRILLSYKLHALRNTFTSPAIRKERLKRLHAKNAYVLRERMIEMRGVLIKIGQFLSSRVDILPEEYTNELSKLQDQVPPANLTDIMKRVIEEIGPPEEIFSSFDETPIASASLGQVHRARLKSGEDIAVKVQYPGIEVVIAADIRTLSFVIKLLKVLYRRINLDVIYSEFSRIIREELDYIQEGKNAEAFARNFAHNPKIKIPVVYWPFTTSKVLTLEFIEGAKISDFEEIDAQGIDRKEAARALAEAYAQMFFTDGLFHGDPHPGNIFVRPGPQIVLVDFGMVDRLSPPKKEGLKRAFTAIMERDSLGLVRALVDMGFIPLTRDVQPLVQFVDKVFSKYRDMSPGQFKAMDIEEMGNDIMEALQLSPSIQIPNDFILFGRVVGMLNGLGSQLDPETNIIEIATPFAKRFILADKVSAAAFFEQAGVAGRSLIRLPKLLTDFLVSTGRGETRVAITSRDIVGELKTISRIGKGLILALLITGAGIAAAAFRINHYDRECAWSLAACGVLSLWLVFLLRKRQP